MYLLFSIICNLRVETSANEKFPVGDRRPGNELAESSLLDLTHLIIQPGLWTLLLLFFLGIFFTWGQVIVCTFLLQESLMLAPTVTSWPSSDFSPRDCLYLRKRSICRWNFTNNDRSKQQHSSYILFPHRRKICPSNISISVGSKKN